MRARMALKLTNTKCELREVRLNNKPKQMIDKSPKGTVPVLVLKKKVIDESNDIIEWALSSNNIFDGNIDHDQIDLTNNLIELFDSKFKYNLDRYKYATRYENIDKVGFYMGIKLKPINLFDDFVIDLEPQYLAPLFHFYNIIIFIGFCNY